MAVKAMVIAMASDRSLWLRTWAFAAGARPKANADTSEMPAARYAMLDMSNLPIGSRIDARPRSDTRSSIRICIRISRSEPPTLSAGRLLFAVGRRSLILRHLNGFVSAPGVAGGSQEASERACAHP